MQLENKENSHCVAKFGIEEELNKKGTKMVRRKDNRVNGI